jgi:hypothetical protein
MTIDFMESKRLKRKLTKKGIVERVAQELVDGMKEKKELESVTIDTLCNFGSMGIYSPRQVVEAFYNSFSPLIRKQLSYKK